MEKITLVILAAGMGSRFGGLKQMTPVDEEGHFIIDFSLYDAYQAGFRRVAFIIKREIEQTFRETIGARMEKWFHVDYVYQELDRLPEGFAVPEGRRKPWGTAHAVACCRGVVEGPFAVINSDDFYGRGAYEAIFRFLTESEAPHHYAMLGYQLRNTVTEFGSVARGICHVENGFLRDITERTKIFKRGQDADKVMQKLFRMTPLEDSFPCNFNILISGMPRVMGVREILGEWAAFRTECVRRRTYYDLQGKEKRLHLLKGLEAILLDIDKAVRIVRETEEEAEVVPNLMIGFGIDKVQAEYVAEIKLRHLNREYILKRTGEIEQLEKDIADLNDVLAKPARIRRIIINELNDVAKKYAQPRRSEILYDLPEEESGAEEESIPDYPVTVFYTREGYFKKITPQSLRMSGEQKLKEGDEMVRQVETRNNVEALFFTDKQQVYKVRLAELEDGKVAQMGIFIPGRLGMDEGENVLSMVITGDYSGFMLFFFASGKCAKIPLSSYATKQNRRKLLKAYSDKEPLAMMLYQPEETELAIRTSASRMLLVGTAQIAAKTTRDSQGVAVVTLKKNQTIASVVPADTLELANPHRYRVRSLPATGALIRAEDEGEQMSLL